MGLTLAEAEAMERVCRATNVPLFIHENWRNVRLPRSLAGRGEVEVTLTAEARAANPLHINVR